ncbi:MAG TPA: DUF1343 domain-containing protein [Candidatus Blautia stercoravium]|nr:DUF1343 domain-containing protein [Candidatus Blautia stercoravium]
MVKNGIDCIEKYDALFQGRRLGLITSVSGVDQNLKSSIDILAERYDVQALFSPEHGVRGNVDAGGIVADAVDPYTGIPVYSLYRTDSKRLTEEMLEQVDSIVYDIQDIGVRYYTFIWTMYYAMQSCEEFGKELIILDRFNPLGGKVEGNLLQDGYESFIGAYPVCMRYGLTVGELAGMIYGEKKYHFPISVVKAEGWNHEMLFPETGNIWVMPSMGIPRFETALVYAGTCLFEGTNLSEGRGTTAPFEIIGAPYVDAYRFSRHMNSKKLPGVLFRPVYFTPSASKHAQEACEGIQIHVTDYRNYQAAETGFILLQAFRECYPQEFAFLPPFREGGRQSVELLFGSNRILESEEHTRELLAIYAKDSREFKKRKTAYHIYD